MQTFCSSSDKKQQLGKRRFKSWIKSRNASTEEKYPADLLEVRYPFHVIDRTLAAFVIEARRVDGNHYPGTTLKNIMAALFWSDERKPGGSKCYELY